MEVIDHRPHAWWLLRQGSDLLLDVNCGHGAVDQPFVMRLAPAEEEAYLASGAAYLGQLAEDIHNSAPGARGSVSPYQARNIHAEAGGAVSRAIGLYRSGNPAPDSAR